jgi:hypothetical protein
VPANAVDIDDDALMQAWAKDCARAEIRVSPPEDAGVLRITCEEFQQLLTPRKIGSA